MNKIRIDNVNYLMLDLTFDVIEEDTLAYSEEAQIIVVFNKSAIKVWEYIKEASLKKRDIFSFEICEMLMSEYNLKSEQYMEISADVSDILLDFIGGGVLVANT